MQSELSLDVLVGSFRLRDPTTRKFLPSVPLYKRIQSKITKNGRTQFQETMIDRCSILLFDLFNDCEENKKPIVEPEKQNDGNFDTYQYYTQEKAV